MKSVPVLGDSKRITKDQKMIVKKYLLFAGERYYPAGGWNDFQGSFGTPLEAAIYAVPCRFDWAHLIDSDTYEKVERFDIRSVPANKTQK